MKKLAKFLGIITAIFVLLTLLYIFSSNLPYTVQMNVLDAADREEKFNTISAQVAEGKYEGVDSLGDISEYCFIDVSVGLKNISPFKAEWITLSVNSAAGDVLLLSDEAGPCDISAFSNGTVSLTILTRDASVIRSGRVEYYIFGRYHCIEW